MYCDYKGDFGSQFNAQAECNASIKRSIRQFEKDALSAPRAKRSKLSNTYDGFSHSDLLVEQQGQSQSSDGRTEMSFITPANTPAHTDMTNKSFHEENLPSPYSETEDYMIRGYYQEEKLVDNSWACIESVQYSLYDLTPEEYEVANDDTDSNDCARNVKTSWGLNEVSKGQLGFQCTFNDNDGNDSYDINMR